MKHYAIANGAEGKTRLKILAQVMQPSRYPEFFSASGNHNRDALVFMARLFREF